MKQNSIIITQIEHLKKEKNAVILAHYYQRPEIQDIADYIGDSFGLARQAAESEAEVIVFCGVHFMAESAAILAPDKIVLLPVELAGCPMADMATVEELIALKKQYPAAAVVSYVNTTAAIKAESDICCTSSNAVRVVNSLTDFNQVIFTPDKNLGQFVANQTSKEIILWDGYCNTHDRLTVNEVEAKKAEYPEAKFIVHPECKPEVTALADYVGSTAGMLRYVEESDASQFIVGTEIGLLHSMCSQYPDKAFHVASRKLICPNMKLTRVEDVLRALETMEPVITVPKKVADKAHSALDRMLDIV